MNEEKENAEARKEHTAAYNKFVNSSAALIFAFAVMMMLFAFFTLTIEELLKFAAMWYVVYAVNDVFA